MSKTPEYIIDWARQLLEQPEEYEFDKILGMLAAIRDRELDSGPCKIEKRAFTARDDYLHRQCTVRIGWYDHIDYDPRTKLAYGSGLSVHRIIPKQDVGLDLEEIARFGLDGENKGIIELEAGRRIALAKDVFEQYTAAVCVKGVKSDQAIIGQERHVFDSKSDNISAWKYQGTRSQRSEIEGGTSIDTRPSTRRGIGYVLEVKVGADVLIDNVGRGTAFLRFEKCGGS